MSERARSKLSKRHGKESFVEDLYAKKTEIKDPRFGAVTFWAKKRGQDLLLMKARKSQTLEGLQGDIMQAKERLKMNHDFLMKMVDYSVKIQAVDQFAVWGFYQAPMQDLRKEIDKRIRIQRLGVNIRGWF